jgi:hypothetical protein
VVDLALAGERKSVAAEKSIQQDGKQNPPMSPYELETLPHTLQRVRTQLMFVVRLEVMPLQVIGKTPGAFRRVGVIRGGEFFGKRLSGKVLGGGSDWIGVRDDASVELDVRVVLQTDDDALIAMTYRGVRHGPVEILERLSKGEEVDPAEYYFRITPRFETAAPRYDWMNRVVAVGVGDRKPEGPIYSIFEVI